MSDTQAITLHVSREGKIPASADTVEIHLPVGDVQPVQTSHVYMLKIVAAGGQRRLTL